MRTAYLAIGVGFVAAVTMYGLGCSSDTPKDGQVDLPPRDQQEDASTPPAAADTGAPAVDCSKTSVKVSDRPACETCAKSKCCKEIAACDESNDCKALIKCGDTCDPSDIFCAFECQTKYPTGTDRLREVGSCTELNCATECPAPDGGIDPFDAGI